jgi:hypothetical protein
VGKTPTPIGGVTPPTPVDNHSEHNAGTVSVSAAKSTHQPIQKWGIDS